MEKPDGRKPVPKSGSSDKGTSSPSRPSKPRSGAKADTVSTASASEIAPVVSTPSPTPPPTVPSVGTGLHYELAEETGKYGERVQLYTAIAEQIWREQQLVSTRMQWNFTFQAFLAGIYVFAGSDLDDWPRFLVQVVLCVAGFVVTLFCLWGVIAAQDQSSRLKEHWAEEFHKHPRPAKVGMCDIKRGAFPQPFSSDKGSNRGRFASRGVCYALMVMWVAMSLIAVATKFYLPVAAKDGTYTCELAQPARSSGGLTINCELRSVPAARQPADIPSPLSSSAALPPSPSRAASALPAKYAAC